MKRWVKGWMPQRVWDNVATVSILGLLAVLSYGFYKIVDNQNAIQQSRVASCKRTYRSFPEMFEPFFPADRKKWSARQRHDWKKLQDRASELAARCGQQTKA